MDEKSHHQHTVLITGGGTGIGKATAIMLAQRGWNVALAGRRAEPIEQVAEECCSASAVCQACAFPADVSDPAQCEKLIATVVNRYGALDSLINNAGGGPAAPASEATPDSVAESFAANALSAAYLIHFAWPIFDRQRGGCIVNVSSMSAHDPYPGLFAYAASKAACESMIRSIHNEKGELDLRAFAIAPGAVETALLRSFIDEETLPGEHCMEPETIATIIVGCIEGDYNDRAGQTILARASDIDSQ
jgi:NAD(P)-dependent dehydrogenase (short-subunit alcohol dehydrogenase family)